MDKKLILRIDELKINKKSEVSNSIDDLKENINRLPKILRFFQEIDIKALEINGNKFIILFKKNHIYLDNKFINLAAKPNFYGNTVVLDLYSLYLKDYKLYMDGKIKVDLNKQKLDLSTNYLIDDIKGHLLVEANNEKINILVSTQKMKDIKILKKYFRLNKIAEDWMYENIKGDFILNNLFLSLNSKTFALDPNSIAGDATITSASVEFNNKLPKVKSEKIDIFYKKGTLSIYLNKAKYLKKEVNDSSVIITNLINKKGLVDVNIKSTTLLDEDINAILNVYNINLPLLQKTGKNSSDLHIKIPYDSKKKLEVKGLFLIKDAKLSIKGFEFFAKEAKIILDNNLVKIQKAKVGIKNLLESDLDLIINTSTLKAQGKAFLRHLKIDTAPNENLIHLKDINSKVEVDLNNIVSIKLEQLKTTILLNKNITNINISDVSSFSQYSSLMRKLNINNGYLNLGLISKKDINIKAKVYGLKLPVLINELKPEFLDISGKYKDNSLFLSTNDKKMSIFIKEDKRPEIKLKDLSLVLYENNEDNKDVEDLNLDIDVNNVLLFTKKEDSYLLENMKININKTKINFEGKVINLDLPLKFKNKKITKLHIKGDYLNKNLNFTTIDKKLKFSLKNNKDLDLFIRNIDVMYDTSSNNEETDSPFENMLIKGKNSNILLNKKRKVLAQSFKLEIKNKTTTINAYYGNSSFYYKKDKNENIKIKASNIDDMFINSLLNKDIVEKGMYNLHATGKGDLIEGTVLIDNSTIKNMAAINNLIILVNTSPGLLNPLFAIPSVLELATQDGFEVNGYKVVKGKINFKYDSKKEILNMYDLKTSGNSVDFEGKVVMDFKKNEIDGDIFVIFMKSYALLIKHIPLVNYIFLGDEKRVDTEVNISGTIDDPKLETNLTKNSLSVPFNILKRIITLPIKAVESVLEEKPKK